MSRPLFTDQPAAWTRTSRGALTQAEYASPVTRFTTPRNWVRAIFVGVGVLLAAVLAVNLIARLA